MSNDEHLSIDSLAAEYVLGTLEKEEREAVERRRHKEPILEKAISDWQDRLAPLNAYVPEAIPREDLFADIEARLDRQLGPTSDEQKDRPDKESNAQRASVTDLDTMKRTLKRWRIAACSSGALAACLAVFLVVKPTPNVPVANAPMIAVFQADDQQPAFIMSMNIAKKELTVRPISAKEQVGKTYQLWIKADQIGPTPHSLGLLSDINGPIQKHIQYDPTTIRHATFGISVEPQGGSPTGQPTGPAIHGTLYPTLL